MTLCALLLVAWLLLDDLHPRPSTPARVASPLMVGSAAPSRTRADLGGGA